MRREWSKQAIPETMQSESTTAVHACESLHLKKSENKKSLSTKTKKENIKNIYLMNKHTRKRKKKIKKRLHARAITLSLLSIRRIGTIKKLK
jgi:hypothetical protein